MTSRIVLCGVFALVGSPVEADDAPARSPVRYHESFDTLDFLDEDAIDRIGRKPRADRGLSLVGGRFGGALGRGPNYVHPDQHNMTHIDLDLASRLRGSQLWNRPYLWGSERIQPMSGSLAFWLRGKLEP